MRYAMVDIMRKPPDELAEVVRQHFTMRKRILEDVCRQWTAKATRTSEYQAEFANVQAELDKLM